MMLDIGEETIINTDKIDAITTNIMGMPVVIIAGREYSISEFKLDILKQVFANKAAITEGPSF